MKVQSSYLFHYSQTSKGGFESHTLLQRKAKAFSLSSMEAWNIKFTAQSKL